MRFFLKRIFFLLLCVVVLAACQDNTDTLGSDMMPDEDLTTQQFRTYPVQMESFKVDSLLARSEYSYLGKYVDPDTRTSIKCDFIAQYNIVEGLQLFPDSVKDNKITGVQINLLINNFVGDEKTSFKLSVYDLDTLIDSEQDFYTNLRPERYLNDEEGVQPIATKWYTIEDYTLTEDQRWEDDYQRSIRIVLDSADLGQMIYEAYREDPSQFSSTYKWVRSGLPFSKGLYFKLEYGDGAMAEIYGSQLCFFFDYYDKQTKKVENGVLRLASTEEVIQATSFENEQSGLDALLEDTEYSYLKTPAGMFTMATLPIDELKENDTISMASVTFTKTHRLQEEKLAIGTPQTLLMIRYDDYRTTKDGMTTGYFERYSLPDSETSYVTTFNSSTNTYSFSNIARLVSKCLHEKQSGKASPNYNKVLLIPVVTTTDNSNNIVKVNHDFSLTSARLLGGKDNVTTRLKVLYSSVNTK